MGKVTTYRGYFIMFLSLIVTSFLSGQEAVPIISHIVGNNGQAEIEIDGKSSYYYLLKTKPYGNEEELVVSMTKGVDGKMILTESLKSLSPEKYSVLSYPINDSRDFDNDGINDVIENDNIPDQNPLNPAKEVDMYNGSITVDDLATFKELSIAKDLVQWAEHLNGKRYVKFIISDFHTSHPSIYFINTNQHVIHQSFAHLVEIPNNGETIRKGEIVFHPASVSDNGTLGTYTFSFSNGKPDAFITVQKVHELLARNMPILDNNLSYYLTIKSEEIYEMEKDLYAQSRIPLLFESDLYAEVDYWALNQAEGYGYFNNLADGETAGSRDIVLLDAIPNNMPRVGGIMTGQIQSPLSHVNIRAVQDNIPNAFIREPLMIDSIADLVGRYIYYKVGQSDYYIREATLAEVNEWYDNLRPDKEQVPELDLSFTEILPLSEISFSMSRGFGAKCANVAEMLTFGFPDDVIPNGYGVPFYFYQEFMKYNSFFDVAKEMMSDTQFNEERDYREKQLKYFRKDIKDGDMPQWMLDQLEEMHRSFPEGTSVRCRSSTNNEDLPGFSGAGLYDSKTQHPDEGHMSKSIKQVFASMWNLEAYDEREFYRINHFVASMGVLCHPNYSDELANGVGVSKDPLYKTEHTFYLNTQVGEDLITNPEANSIAEEILLDNIDSDDDYIVVRKSNLVSQDSIIMSEDYLDEIRIYLDRIHEEFEILYDAEGDETFAMDIEYKITSEGRLSIKQARPWVTYMGKEVIVSPGDPISDAVFISPNPTMGSIDIFSGVHTLSKVMVYDVNGRKVFEQSVDLAEDRMGSVSLDHLVSGLYFMMILDENENLVQTEKIVKL